MSVENLTDLVPVPHLPPVSERVRLRKRYRVNQEKFAKDLGISVRTFYRWETGKGIVNPDDIKSPAYRKYAETLATWREKERTDNEG
jgi:DNA-binding XRE family transcriptional regulator